MRSAGYEDLVPRGFKLAEGAPDAGGRLRSPAGPYRSGGDASGQRTPFPSRPSPWCTRKAPRVTSRVPEIRAAMDHAAHPALLLVDAISSLGCIDCWHDEWQVDVTIAGSQKGLMLPPGLGFTAISGKARSRAATASLPRSYRHWEAMRAANVEGFFPFTPATNPLYGLREAVDMLLDEDLDRVFARHDRHAAATRAAVGGWGLEVLCRARTSTAPRSRRAAARWPRYGRAARADPPAVRHGARRRSVEARRARGPDRPSRRLQRPHAVRDVERCGDAAPDERPRAWRAAVWWRHLSTSRRRPGTDPPGSAQGECGQCAVDDRTRQQVVEFVQVVDGAGLPELLNPERDRGDT